jgi:rhamnulokinase
VGGGSRNLLLNQLTAKSTGLEVTIGPAECTTIGNFAIQLAALSGKYTPAVGVDSKAVAHYAGLLADQRSELTARTSSLLPTIVGAESGRLSG